MLFIGCLIAILPSVGCTKESGYKDMDYSVDRKWLSEKQLKLNAKRPHARMVMGVSTSLILGEGTLSRKDFDNYSLAEGTINAALETGAVTVRVGAVDDAWILGNKEEIELDDRLIERLKKKGASLFFWDWQYSSVLSRKKVSWNEYKKLHLKRIEFFINRYRPDYYSIVTEPTASQYYNVNEKVGLEQWFEHIREMTDHLKARYPGLKLAVLAVPGEDDAFLEGVLDIKGLDIIGIEIYYRRHVEALERYLEKHHPHDRGKQIWMLETWAGMPYPFTKVKDKEKEDIDWMKMMVNIAKNNGFDGFMPWPWMYFISYDSNFLMSPRPDFSSRTEIFRIYRDLSRTTGRP